MNDKTILTASDSLYSKLSSCLKGYYYDPYIEIIYNSKIKKHNSNIHINRQPIINRGYYVRVHCIQQIINSYLNIVNKLIVENELIYPQIINLGCGFDSLGIQLVNNNNNIKVYEIDYHDVIVEKSSIIMSNTILKDAILNKSINESEQIKQLSNGLIINNLILLSIDLQDSSSIINQILSLGFDPAMPTLVITECVLVYVDKTSSDHLINSLGSLLTNGLWVSYDMFNPLDTFGKTMLKNLNNAGFNIPGFVQYPSLDSQRLRFTDNNWRYSSNCTMLTAYHTFTTNEDKRRIQNIELLDEIEEWNLIMSHYSFNIASNNVIFQPIINLLA